MGLEKEKTIKVGSLDGHVAVKAIIPIDGIDNLAPRLESIDKNLID